MRDRRPAIPFSVRTRIEEETFGVCAVSTCFKPSTQRHHIDGNNKNNDPNNIIYICGSCHDLCHYRGELVEDDFHRYKKYLNEFTPDRKYSLEEIVARMKMYYEQGNFLILRDAVNILFKFHDNKKIGKKIIAWLYKLLSEINIQTGNLSFVSDLITKSRDEYLYLNDFDNVIHANGLFAVHFIKNNDYDSAKYFLGMARKQSKDKLSERQRNIRLGWINNVLSDISIKSNKLEKAKFYAEESIKFYERVLDDIGPREKADMFFQTAKVFVAKGDQSYLIDAERFLDKSEELLRKSGWEQSIIKWHIIQFDRYKKLNELEEAKKYLYLAWNLNKNSTGLPKTMELLHLVKENRHLCLEEIISDLY